MLNYPQQNILFDSIRPFMFMKIFILEQSKEDDSSSSESSEDFDKCPCRGHIQRHISHHRRPCNAIFGRQSENCNSRVHVSRVRNTNNQEFLLIPHFVFV